MNPSPLHITTTEQFVWYAWRRAKPTEDYRWRATCWQAATAKEAVQLLTKPLMHTEFHSGVPMRLVRQTTISTTEPDYVEELDGIRWINGVPEAFVNAGLGHGSRVLAAKGERDVKGYITAFKDGHTASVHLYTRGANLNRMDMTLTDIEEARQHLAST